MQQEIATPVDLIELSCEFLFSICLLLCLCRLLLQSCLLLSILLWSFLNGSWLLCLGVLFCCYMGVFFSTLKKKRYHKNNRWKEVNLSRSLVKLSRIFC